MKLIKRLVALAIVAGAAMATTPTIIATTDTPADETIVAAMAAPPEFLFYTECFEPTRSNVAIARAVCDAGAEKRGYNHGILRPLNPNDDIGILVPMCDPPKTGEPAGERYYCFGVGGQ